MLYVTNPNINEARNVAKFLLEERLVAGVDFIPIKSMYWLLEEIKEDEEIISLMKTTEDKVAKIEKVLSDIHSYSNVTIIKLPAECNDSFLSWVKTATNP